MNEETQLLNLVGRHTFTGTFKEYITVYNGRNNVEYAVIKDIHPKEFPESIYSDIEIFPKNLYLLKLGRLKSDDIIEFTAGIRNTPKIINNFTNKWLNRYTEVGKFSFTRPTTFKLLNREAVFTIHPSDAVTTEQKQLIREIELLAKTKFNGLYKIQAAKFISAHSELYNKMLDLHKSIKAFNKLPGLVYQGDWYNLHELKKYVTSTKKKAKIYRNNLSKVKVIEKVLKITYTGNSYEEALKFVESHLFQYDSQVHRNKQIAEIEKLLQVKYVGNSVDEEKEFINSHSEELKNKKNLVSNILYFISKYENIRKNETKQQKRARRLEAAQKKKNIIDRNIVLFNTLQNIVLKQKSAKLRPINNNSKIISLDLETTGLNNISICPSKNYVYGGDEILQVSIIDGNGKLLINEYCKPFLHETWFESQSIHGISPSKVQNKKHFCAYIPKIQSIIDSADVIIGYNTYFDINMLKASGIQIERKIVVDVADMAAPILGKWNWFYGNYSYPSLQKTAKHFNYKYNAHNSLEDAKATLFCYKKLTAKKNSK